MPETLLLTESQYADFEAFKKQVHRKTGIDLNLYKPQQMHRRLLGLIERAGMTSFVSYFTQIENSPDELAVFLDRLTINVSELFRNPEKWDELRERVLPPLLKRARAERRPLRVWSAGCSIGAEPYTIAMILNEIAPEQQYYLLATDIDRKILEKAQRGEYTEADIKNVPEAYRRKYLKGLPKGTLSSPDVQVVPELRQKITFKRHNLLADAFEEKMDLIVCRNVVIYFTDEAKERLYGRFHDSLLSGGILFVGGTERVFNSREVGFHAPLPFFYERAA